MPTATTSPTSAGSSPPRRSATPWLPVVAAVLMLYTLGIGAALLSNAVDPDLAWIFMAIPCLVPTTWCAIGFFRHPSGARDSGEQDAALLLSALGWALVAAGLVAKYFAILDARPDAYASQAPSPLTLLGVGLGVLCLILGGALSWISWLNEND